MASSKERKRSPWRIGTIKNFASDDLSAIDQSMAAPDFNQQLFASGQQSGALGSHGGGNVDEAKGSSLRLLDVVGTSLRLPVGKDSKKGWLAMADTNGFLSGKIGGSGIFGIGQEKSGDRMFAALQNTGSGNGTAGIGEPSSSGNYFQGMVAASRGESGERSV